MLIPLIVACALFMENLDSSVVSTSLPEIARDLAVDPISLKLAFTSYLISIAVFTPISGWVADRFGSRTVFRLAIVVFVGGSILCGLSSTLEGFVAARIIQGAGGAMMVPVGRLVLLRSIVKSDYLRALSWLTVPGLIGPVLGPPVGGFITTYFQWRWIFWINVPISILGLVLVSIFITNYREENLRPLDTVGFMLSSVGLAGFVFGIAASGIGLLPHWLILTMIFGGFASLIGYVVHARKVEGPLIDLRLFEIDTFRISVFAGILFRIGVGAIPFLLPLLLQIGFGMTPFQSGMLTFSAAAGAMTMKFTAPRILKAFGFRSVLIFNTIITTTFMLMILTFTKETLPLVMFGILLVGGFFRSLQFTALNGLAYADLDQKRMSQGTSLTSVIQQISVALGVAVAAGALEWTRSQRADPTLVASDFLPAFAVLAVIGLMSIPLYTRLDRNAGAEVSGRHVEEEASAA
ncbi:DHA2 family efflux MFS transporter permease subunit [Oryzibacter oryziterrae]|uniref:DHA2 family efflux MFS transporter permease subunit n=1 Tax=Oryzibacter oryziterrae TaxID=2766474 RepID=UPI001F02D128|nr:DHA2 family efflux MFS transporter permease subunit [Oryzibacter oryziterrae]